MKRFGARVTVGVLAACVAFGLSACSNNDQGGGDMGGGDMSATASRHYAGAGSAYTVDFNDDGTFKLTHAPMLGATPDQSINGKYQTFPTGFSELTVSSATGVDAKAGDQAYALEIPGHVLFLKPIGADGNLIALIPAGQCPTGTLHENWVEIKPNSQWVVTAPSSGAFSFDPTSGTATLPAGYSLNAPTTSLGSQTLGTGSCSGGTLGIPSQGVNLFLTASGGAGVSIAHTDADMGASDEAVFALPQASAAIDVAGLAGKYAGLVYSLGGDRNFAVSLDLATSGSGVAGTGMTLSDVTTGTALMGAAHITIDSAGPQPGIVEGTIATPGGNNGTGALGPAKPMTCIAQTNVGTPAKTVMACAATDQNNEFFSIMLVSL